MPGAKGGAVQHTERGGGLADPIKHQRIVFLDPHHGHGGNSGIEVCIEGLNEFICDDTMAGVRGMNPVQGEDPTQESRGEPLTANDDAVVAHHVQYGVHIHQGSAIQGCLLGNDAVKDGGGGLNLLYFRGGEHHLGGGNGSTPASIYSKAKGVT